MKRGHDPDEGDSSDENLIEETVSEPLQKSENTSRERSRLVCRGVNTQCMSFEYRQRFVNVNVLRWNSELTPAEVFFYLLRLCQGREQRQMTDGHLV